MSQHTLQARPRYDLYAGIHKALRAFMSETLLQVGRFDADDAQDLRHTGQQLRELCEVLESHVRHENDFVHGAMEARRAGSSVRIDGEHVEHLEHIAALRTSLDALEQIAAGQRAPAALALYRQLAMFVAENFEHMDVEEREHNAVLRAEFTDEELAGIEGAIVASHAPAEMARVLRWMLPSFNHSERVALLAGMRAMAPPPVFEGALEIARAQLGERDWSKLEGALGLVAEAA